ncbi:ABC transporter ATP-binding protein [Nitratireductor sp. L1-7-SE]|uniref:ABC transporter ATP-binding protein n=1 Tax=Nitratireductor rhodophyticola TaxID=2854036 RepID=A0ABS7RAH5_9HYPH|nr:ABC transporter ATP-binding protein [Nitratireductor rhodophyticola]MBY8917940.1 ABC transporter ATP-binding protein [Nitratireductor rhodophyticola]MBY8922651.1 ABC transporter ATP-binding protein [Nitratireductor rhodophyticola]
MNDLELIGVGKTYPDGTVAVSDFDLAVQPGEFVAFLGPSGCGKSTTLRMIAGFEDISNGDILIKGKNVSAIPPEKRPTSMIFQNYALFPHMTVRQNIGFGLDVKGLSSGEKKAKVDRIMEMFGLSDFADRKADRLSGGQRQRIALARGLVVEPDILLLDEPLGALDANLRRVIQNELKLLQRELGITFVFVTHAQSEALGLSDRIVVMNRGRVEQIGTPHEVYASPATEFVARFIGSNAIIEGSNLSFDGDAAFVDTVFGRMHGRRSQSLAPGAAALVTIPAEAMRIQPANSSAAEGENRLYGTVSMKHAVGSVGHFKVDLDGQQSVDVQTGTDNEALMRLAIGDAVIVDCPSDRVTLVARG